jgi:periplasmic divalent cation tolerance protein
VLLTTAPKAEEAARLARALVEERLAACVQLVPGVRSFYRWKGEVQDDPELLLLIKTTPDRREQVIARLQELHSYDVPEAVAITLDGGSEAYLSWLEEVTR